MNESGGMVLSRTLGEVYTGARATPNLVGRKSILADIYATLHPPSPSSIIYVTGAGGTGKTRLIQHVIDEVAHEPNLIVADQLIDLYHTRNRTVGGIIESILNVVEPLRTFLTNRPAHTQIDEMIIRLSRAEQEGLSASELISQLKELTDILIDQINNFTRDHRLVLALDTAERLFIARDKAQERLGLTDQRPEVLDWVLTSLLPNLNNAAILIAGRPGPLNLTDDLNKVATTTGQKFLPIELQGLNEPEAMEYIDTVIESAKQSDNLTEQQAAKTILLWSEEERQVIFHSLHDGGKTPRIRPILLALAIDHLIIAGHPLPILNRTLEDAQNLENSERRQLEIDLSDELVKTLRENWRPADLVLLTLGWLRKGADKELLRKLTALSDENIDLALEQIKGLSFIKIRPADNRIFLHDEMYDLLQKFTEEDTSPSERSEIYQAITEYYKTLIKKTRKKIDQLYQPQANTYKETLPRPSEVRQARAQLQDAFIEDIYYRLRWNSKRAFQQYVFYAEEAVGGSDDTLTTLLRSELLSYQTEQNRDDFQIQTDILQEADVIADSAVRWVIWAVNNNQPNLALKIIQQLGNECNDLLAPGGMIAKTHLTVYHANLLINNSEYSKAEDLLDKTIKQLENLTTHTLQSAVILARAYHHLGYLHNRQNRPYRAIEADNQAIFLWQRVGLDVERANVLNNRSFNLAILGRFHEAIPDSKEGLRLQEFLGPRVPVGLSVNTKALIEIWQHDFEGAVRDIERALEIFERIDSKRGQGLALIALSDAKRLLSRSITYIQQSQSAQLLEEAVGHAGRAVEIFDKEAPEPARLIEASQKQGIAYRDWAKLRLEHPNIISKGEDERRQLYTVEILADMSTEAIEKGIGIAQKRKSQSLVIDLRLNLALLIYHTELHLNAADFEMKAAELEAGFFSLIEKDIPNEYRQPPQPNSQLEKEWYLVQSGKLELLRGYVAFRSWHINKKMQYLQKAFEHYALTLAYFDYFSEYIFFEKRQAMDQIHEHLSLLDSAQYAQLYTWMDELDAKYWPGSKSAMRTFVSNRFGGGAKTIQIDDF